MAITLTQTDTAAACAAQTCGNTLNSQTSSKKATSGGTAGITAVSLTADASASSLVEILFQSSVSEPNNCSWESGNWDFNLEVTTANKNVSWEACVVNSITSGCVCTNIGSFVIAGGTPLGTVGVVTVSGTPTGFPSSRSSTDMIYVQYQISGITTMTQAWAYKPSQNIVTPILQSANCGAPPAVTLSYRRMRMGMGV